MPDHYLFAASFLSSRLSQSRCAGCSVTWQQALALAAPLKQKKSQTKVCFHIARLHAKMRLCVNFHTRKTQLLSPSSGNKSHYINIQVDKATGCHELGRIRLKFTKRNKYK